MRTVYKYPLEIADVQTVHMPRRAVILTVQNQGGKLCLWAELDNQEKVCERTIEIFGTGHQISAVDNRVYIGTAQQLNGALVWHVYERTTNNGGNQ